MATVTIAGRALEVAPDTLGFRKHRLIPWALQYQKEGPQEPAELHEAAIACFLLYVGHNEGVTREWAESVLPAEIGPVMAAVRLAANKSAQVAALGEGAAP